MTARASAGVAPELDRHRADADVARAEQTVAEAELEVALARRELELLTALAPNERAAVLDEDLAPEAPLERWTARGQARPR